MKKSMFWNLFIQKPNQLKIRSARLESARFEAKKEIAKYREEEERKFSEYVAKVCCFFLFFVTGNEKTSKKYVRSGEIRMS